MHPVWPPPQVNASRLGASGEGQYLGFVPPQTSPHVRFSRAFKASLPIDVIALVTIVVAIFWHELILWLPKHVFRQSVGCFKAPDGGGFISR